VSGAARAVLIISLALVGIACVRLLWVYWRVRVLRSLLYLSTGGGLAALAWVLRLAETWQVASDIAVWIGVVFFALGTGRAATVESGLYSTMRKRTRWADLLFGKALTFLIEERERVDPPSTRARALLAGCLLTVGAPPMAFILRGNAYLGIPFALVGITIVVYALVLLDAVGRSGGRRTA
jgi:hypothetical protein